MNDKVKLKIQQYLDKAWQCTSQRHDVEAFDNFQKAAKLGDPEAQYRVARYYLRKFDGTTSIAKSKGQLDTFISKMGDGKRAYKWLDRAATQNHLGAMALLGGRYLKERFDHRDERKKQRISMYYYFSQSSTSSSYDRGYEMLVSAAEQGNLSAKYYLARYHYHCVERVNINTIGEIRVGYPTSPVPVLLQDHVNNKEHCFRLLGEAAAKGHPKATYYYGLMCQARGMPQQAYDSFVTASQAGVDLATMELANCHYIGYNNIPMDADKAYDILLKCTLKAMKGGLLPYHIVRMSDRLPVSLRGSNIDVTALSMLQAACGDYNGVKNFGGISMKSLYEPEQHGFKADMYYYDLFRDYYVPEYHYLHFALFGLCHLHRYATVERRMDTPDMVAVDPVKLLGKTSLFNLDRTIPVEYFCDLAVAQLANPLGGGSKQAVKTLKKAMTVYNIPEAYYRYGIIKLNHKSEKTEKGIKAIEQAHQMGHPLAYRTIYYNISSCTTRKTNDTTDSVLKREEAFRFVLKVANETGSSYAQVDIGTLYRDGLGVVKDLSQAESWYRRSVAQGNPEAKCLLAVLLLETNSIAYAREIQRLIQESISGGYTPASIYLPSKTKEEQIEKAKQIYNDFALSCQSEHIDQEVALTLKYGCYDHVTHIMSGLSLTIDRLGK
ncbi:hypothetical protein DFA_01251 [Cavenderia fasciculata]|uniref:Uncharacterized protein n=1 Tax=Cavenderia fasciculata TaxID=261658 RepID=F4PRN0_CACFS|nr:uncharacterized protein DFA_01251 [Cavenderia fasciculata]EGG21370.1 hypothetical protein DFA_01251 [Cavenderia fasciculata]|eukprot:XP_004359220.1 hypothetical protein DFA_01251 [Cavenderia fasciculata]